MKLKFSPGLAFIVCLTFFFVADSESAELKKYDYVKHSDEMGVIIVDVNWGRQWGCGKFENAQLERLKFEKFPLDDKGHDKYSEIQLESPSRLFVKNQFHSYGFLVNPGKYAFTEWSVKVAKSTREVGYFNAGRDKLVDGSNYPGGTFEVSANEIVYIGSIFLDCLQTPIPWRYYADGKDAFLRHIEEYKKKYKFIKDREIKFRLLDTKYFGEEYSLPE